jgi:hypothetical protein
MDQVVEPYPSNPEALSSKPSTAQREKGKRKKKQEGGEECASFVIRCVKKEG